MWFTSFPIVNSSLPVLSETQGLWITCLSITELSPSGSRRLCPLPPNNSLLWESMGRTACLTGSQRDRSSWPGGQMVCPTWGKSTRLVWGKHYHTVIRYTSEADAQKNGNWRPSAANVWQFFGHFVSTNFTKPQLLLRLCLAVFVIKSIWQNPLHWADVTWNMLSHISLD